MNEKQFLQERDEMLTECILNDTTEPWYKFMQKHIDLWDDSFLYAPKRMAEVTIRKTAFRSKGISADVKQAAREWLIAEGYKPGEF